jgi:dTDP-4-dehydrorhamnose 3,5-epimerase
VSFSSQSLSALPEVRVLSPQIFPDARGVFFESWNAAKFADLDLDVDFVQDNHSISAAKVLRGLHYQLPPKMQGKLVRVVVGEVFDVAVDIRRSSPTFGRWAGRRLSAENREMLWIPLGFAHGFYVLSAGAEVVYKCTEAYSSAHDRVLLWNDPDLAIDWPLAPDVEPSLSDKDSGGASWRTAELLP